MLSFFTGNYSRYALTNFVLLYIKLGPRPEFNIYPSGREVILFTQTSGKMIPLKCRITSIPGVLHKFIFLVNDNKKRRGVLCSSINKYKKIR